MIGGWLVLEPWITPSLFYQFLGASAKWGDDAKHHVGLDCRSFCTALGKEEANRQLRNHWRTWVTEEQIAKLASFNVEHIRIPVADWIFEPYEPFIGCWDGALEELYRVLDLCQQYGIDTILDMHGWKGSQVSRVNKRVAFVVPLQPLFLMGSKVVLEGIEPLPHCDTAPSILYQAKSMHAHYIYPVSLNLALNHRP